MESYMIMQEKIKSWNRWKRNSYYNFEILDFISPYIKFKIECSKGPY